jgi:hypothetical protein
MALLAATASVLGRDVAEDLLDMTAAAHEGRLVADGTLDTLAHVSPHLS